MFTAADLQRELIKRKFDIGPTGVDGVLGGKTMRALDGALAKEGLDDGEWSDSRKRIAFEQIFYRDAGIETGKIDGLIGEQTRYARQVWDARQRNKGQPDPKVEAWRDKAEESKPAPAATEAHARWPRQQDVEAFYGKVGENQVTLELPFPMRIAWELDKEVHRFSCHAKVHDALKAIWTQTLEKYGIDRVRELRLDLYGGCLNVRKMKGGSRWSMHSWGIAEDVDPDRNQLNFKRNRATLDDTSYDDFWRIVYGQGALSLGRERDYDWMHFQFTRDFS